MAAFKIVIHGVAMDNYQKRHSYPKNEKPLSGALPSDSDSDRKWYDPKMNLPSTLVVIGLFIGAVAIGVHLLFEFIPNGH